MKIEYRNNNPTFVIQNDFDEFLFDLLNLNCELTKLKLLSYKNLERAIEVKDNIEILCETMREKYSEKLGIEK